MLVEVGANSSAVVPTALAQTLVPPLVCGLQTWGRGAWQSLAACNGRLRKGANAGKAPRRTCDPAVRLASGVPHSWKCMTLLNQGRIAQFGRGRGAPRLTPELIARSGTGFVSLQTLVPIRIHRFFSCGRSAMSLRSCALAGTRNASASLPEAAWPRCRKH